MGYVMLTGWLTYHASREDGMSEKILVPNPNSHDTRMQVHAKTKKGGHHENKSQTSC